MRNNGVEEKYITGDASKKEKFLKWAETIPYTVGNPLYHWTHLELKNYFGIFLVFWYFQAVFSKSIYRVFY